MRTIIAGSRNFDDYRKMHRTITSCDWEITRVVSGAARGADKLGERWALNNGIPVDRYPADWDKYGKSAGYKRNQLMAENADALIAFWDGFSKGTANMIHIAKRAGLKIFVCEYQAG